MSIQIYYLEYCSLPELEKKSTFGVCARLEEEGIGQDFALSL